MLFGYVEQHKNEYNHGIVHDCIKQLFCDEREIWNNLSLDMVTLSIYIMVIMIIVAKSKDKRKEFKKTAQKHKGNTQKMAKSVRRSLPIKGDSN